MTNQSFESTDAMKKFVLETVDELSDLLKSLQHPKRLEILALVMIEEQEFSSLMEKTKLPKSALGNHLAVLFLINIS